MPIRASDADSGGVVAGFITNSVELIQRILFDGRKTDETLVLKELVQNADDAHAQVLQVGIDDGLADADHPLLRGRGLYVVNDGPFEEKHARAVRSLGGSSKVEEAAAIGKFGIGLKSVFYLGEVFFFLCRSNDDDGRDVLSRAQVLNPWNDGQEDEHSRPEWDLFTPADRARMRRRLDGRGVTDGFTIWVPLRTRESTRLADGELSVYQAYPGDEELERTLFSRRVYDEIARMLPLMRHLRVVQFHSPDGTVILDIGDSTRSLYPELVGERTFGGKVRGEGVADHHFAATEQLLATPRIGALRADGHWPRRRVPGAGRQTEDKTRAHAAVTLERQETGSADRVGGTPYARLVIRWAAFLPLGEEESVRIGGRVDFHLTLHGCFFITADRRDILSWRDVPQSPTETSSQLQQQWNAELARGGTLPLVLPTLADFARGLTTDEVTRLTMGLWGSNLFRSHRMDLCRRGQWVLTLDRGWKLVEPGTRLLPCPRTEGIGVENWLSGFREMARNATVIEADAPHLIASSLSTWSDVDLEILFRGLRLADLDGPGLERLARVLKVVAHDSNWEARRSLLSGVSALDPKALAASSGELKTLVETTPVERRLVLPKNLAHHVRRRLALLPIAALVLPGEVDVTGEARLSSEDALTIIHALAGQRGTTDAVKRVLGAVAEEARPTLRVAVAELPFVEIRKLEGRDPEFISPVDAWDRITNGRLHRDTDSSREWGKVAESALSGLETSFTDAALIEALGGRVGPFDPHVVTGLVRRGLPFVSLSGRLGVLQKIMEKNLLEEFDPLVRATLQGRSDQMDDPVPLYVVERERPTLERLARQLLSGQSWQVVPKVLADLLNRPARDLMSLKPLETEEVAALIRRFGTVRIDAGEFGRDERLALLGELPKDVARALPFHPSRGGTSVSLTPDSLLPGTAQLPPGLSSSVTILQPDPLWLPLWTELGVGTLDSRAALERVLGSAEPYTHALWILEQVTLLDEETLEDLREELTGRNWLPDSSVKYVTSPANLLVLPELADTVGRVVAEAGEIRLTRSDLAEELTVHPGFHRLVDAGFTLSGEAAVMELAKIMSTRPDGRYRTGDDDRPFGIWWTLFAGVDPSKLPALDILIPLHAVAPDWAREVRERLKGPLADLSLSPVLNHLADLLRRKLVPQAERDETLRMHSRILEQVRDRKLWSEVRKGLLLRDRQGVWRDAGDLCVQAEGVTASAVLHQEQQLLLGDVLTPKTFSRNTAEGDDGALDVDASLAATAARLETYFAAWEGLVPSELIGAFLSLLGGDPGVESVSKRHLHSRSLGVVREIVEEDARQRPSGVKSFAEWSSLSRVTLEVSSEDRLWVMSLTDEPLRVTKDASRPSVVVGRPEPGRLHGDVYVSRIVLNGIDPATYSREELSEALLAATRAVLHGMYLVRTDHLEDLWRQLSESDQFDLLYTQDMIVQDSISYMRYQLSLPGRHPLNDLFARWDIARHREAEERYNPLVRRHDQASQEIGQLRGELRDALENSDPEVVGRLLSAVRRRVGDAQYLPASIPFELLQNADDALEELGVMRGGRPVDDTFVIETGKDTLSFRHWGRTINQFALPGFDGETLGFKADLKKMLMLAASDKGASDMQVTGKFGMGFKSVYLVAERPRVVSGRLAFEVVGGVYPKRLDKDRSGLLRDGLERHGDRMRGTAIELDVGEEEARPVLTEFRAWLPLLLVFTRRVKRVVDVTPQGTTVVSWQELPVDGAFWRVGSVHPPQAALDRAMVCELPSGKVLFALGLYGLTVLPDDVPTLWVTAPTRSHARAGLAVNAMFALDIGRSEVASRAPENEELARRLGRELAEALASLRDRARDWPRLVEDLALAADATPQTFWKSVWVLLGDRAPDPSSNFAARLVHLMVWGNDDTGLWSVLKRHQVLPTGLVGDHDVLTSLDRVARRICGVLAGERMFAQHLESATLSLRYPPGSLVHETVAARLLTLTGGQVQWAELTLLDVLTEELGERPEIGPEQAARFAVDYTSGTLATLGDEKEGVSDYLATFRFRTVAGHYIPASEIVVGLKGEPVSPDERLRAAFAPRSRLLHPDYQAAIGFVTVCRDGLSADARTLASWAGDASEEATRRAVLTYLLSGHLASSLAEELHKGPETWLANVLDLPVFLSFSNDERHILAGYLKQGDRLDRKTLGGTREGQDVPPSRTVENPARFLRELYAEWAATSQAASSAYEQTVYPSFMRPDGLLLPFGEDRKRWMALLLLGTYQSLGRATPQQNRDFLQLAERRGWLDIFAATEVDPVKWFEILDGFLSGSPTQEYYHWFSRFLATYQLSRHLDVYMSILSGLGRLPGPRSLDMILNPSGSALFSGSGIDVPDLRRAMGIGRHFVLRELLRTGTVVTPHMHAEAFHPSASVRRALAALGCDVDPKAWGHGDSRTIHRFLVGHLGEAGATFQGAFDLPFVQSKRFS
ncbi:sacsin N-terminal ATP-binding-like domain-containing protein [Deinococcus alpinitundrae]|uniref:sacsin N-terminal ATP-binding-like domain-containing protein n=1 Tax=Deinococcus alpinitundrae TaxID=468913 RepID=UPI00137A3806|nr:hypothetical protein [Deinococcus alpinitundrae]